MKQIVEYLLSKKNNKVINENKYVVWASFDVFTVLDDKYHNKTFNDKNCIYYWLLTGEEIVEALKDISEEKILKQFKAYEVPKNIDEETLKKKMRSGDIRTVELKGTTYENIYYHATFN